MNCRYNMHISQSELGYTAVQTCMVICRSNLTGRALQSYYQEITKSFCFRLYSTLLNPLRMVEFILPLSLYGVVEFMLPLFAVGGRGVYTPAIRCRGLWSLYSTLLIPVLGRGVFYLVNREILLELGSKSRSDALSATTIDLSGIRTHDSLRANHVF